MAKKKIDLATFKAMQQPTAADFFDGQPEDSPFAKLKVLMTYLNMSPKLKGGKSHVDYGKIVLDGIGEQRGDTESERYVDRFNDLSILCMPSKVGPVVALISAVLGMKPYQVCDSEENAETLLETIAELSTFGIIEPDSIAIAYGGGLDLELLKKMGEINPPYINELMPTPQDRVVGGRVGNFDPRTLDQFGIGFDRFDYVFLDEQGSVNQASAIAYFATQAKPGAGLIVTGKDHVAKLADWANGHPSLRPGETRYTGTEAQPGISYKIIEKLDLTSD
ncbi:hypothetical protein ACFL0W_02045 [Nanoarchaeota archaeon]